jgi:hypothetical protein
LEVLVKRRICLATTVLAAVPLAVGISVTAAGAKSAPKKPAANGTAVKCHISLGTVPPAGSPTVEQPPAKGTAYGSVRCNHLGSGIEQANFRVPDSGDTVGKYWQYFGNGSIHGTFDLTPTEANGALSSSSFSNETWEGKVTVTGGTGAFANAAGKKGTMKCTSGDTVHLTCTEKIKLTGL